MVSDHEPSPWKALGLIGAIGVDIAVCTLLGLWIGTYISEWLNQKWWAVIGMFIGLILGCITAVMLIRNVLRSK
ncbi:AtpZ/AtpI family protein [Longirhabdus pacifica]|uniref:AtpZ/AtpI family protein n=1 Tax=Longirhabdus pacifica TaxID=2305227 RepID=UPI0013E8D0BA|nr:AtpZ/AtpI family protein [Longirhabdus pacifica]